MMSAEDYAGTAANPAYGAPHAERDHQHQGAHQLDHGQAAAYYGQANYDTSSWSQNPADHGYGSYGGPVGYDCAATIPLKDEGTSSYGSYDQRSGAHGYGQEGGEADASGPYSGVYDNNSGRSEPPNDKQVREGDWYCESCNNFNFARRMECNRCRAPRAAAAGAAGAGVAGGGGRGGPPRNPGDWTCQGCQNLNFARRVECNRCRAPRPPEMNAAPIGEYRAAAAPAASVGRATGGGYGGASSGYEQAAAGDASSGYGGRGVSSYRDTSQQGSYASSPYPVPSSTNAAPYNYNAASAANTSSNYATGTSHGSGQAAPGYGSGAGSRYGNAGSSYAEVNSYYGEGEEQAQGGRGGPPYGGAAQGMSSGAYDDSQKDEDGGEKSADTIYVENLSHDVTVEDIAQFFGSIGVIKLDKKNNNKPKVWLYQDRTTGLPKGDATITYDDPPSSDAAIAWFNGKEFKGRIIKVSKAAVAKGAIKHRERHGGGGRGGGRGGYGGAAGRGGASTQGRPGDWTCEGCNNSNFARRDTCYRCQAPKPAGAGGGYGSGGGAGGYSGGGRGYGAGGGSYAGSDASDGGGAVGTVAEEGTLQVAAAAGTEVAEVLTEAEVEAVGGMAPPAEVTMAGTAGGAVSGRLVTALGHREEAGGTEAEEGIQE